MTADTEFSEEMNGLTEGDLEVGIIEHSREGYLGTRIWQGSIEVLWAVIVYYLLSC